MSNEKAKMQPWQVFQAARKHLGAERVARIFNREVRSAHNWAQDPVYTQCRCKTPLELLRNLFVEMDTVGRGDVAREAINYLAGAVDPVVDAAEIKMTLPTIQQEILADYSKVAALQHGIEDGLDISEISYLKQEAIDEIERTFAKYAEKGRHDR